MTPIATLLRSDARQQGVALELASMSRRKRYRPSAAEIEHMLDRADVMLAAGAVEPEVCRALGISPRLYSSWRNRQLQLG
jgi:hypothetical protein